MSRPHILLTLFLALIFSANIFAMGKTPQKNLNNQQVNILIKDSNFNNGFDVISPMHPNFGVVDERIVAKFNVTEGTAPVWMLEQWHSKFNIGDSQPVKTKDGSLKYSNESMTVIIGKEGTAHEDLTLAMDSRPEWNGKSRTENQPWPHLLVEQLIDHASFLDKVAKIPFHIETKVLHAERFELEGYSPGIHAAQFTFVLIIKNDNPQSPGYMDFMWFQVPIYDDRAEFPGRHVQQDFADHTTKMIYNAGGHVYTNKSLYSGDWVTYDLDLRPLIVEGLYLAWERGYLQESKNLGDYRIIETNIGWEHAGNNNAAAQIRNLSLTEIIDN